MFQGLSMSEGNKFPLWSMPRCFDGGSGGGEISPEVKAQIEAAVEAATLGLKTKNQELLDKLAKQEKKDGELTTLKEKLKLYEGIDPEKAKKLLANFEDDEDAKLIKDGKIDELLNKRYAKRDEDWQRKLDQAIAEGKTAKDKAAKFLNSVLDDRLRAAFNGVVDPRSMKAALLEAKQIFTLDDDGNAVQLDGEGKAVLGKDKTPFSPSEWISSEDVRRESPYLFPATGSGTGSSQTHGSATTDLDFDKMTPEQKMEAGRKKT